MNSQKHLRVFVLIELDKFRSLEDKAKQLQTLGEKHLKLLNSEPELCVKYDNENSLKRRKKARDQADIKLPREKQSQELVPNEKKITEEKVANSTINASKNRNFIESSIFSRENELPDNWWKILDD